MADDQPQLEGAPNTPAPGPTPEQIAAAMQGLQAMNDALGVWHQARAIALDPSLLAYAAIRRIRRLYEEFDAKHPTFTKGTR